MADQLEETRRKQASEAGGWSTFMLVLCAAALASLGVLIAASVDRAPLAGDVETSNEVVLVGTSTTDDAMTATVTLESTESRPIITRSAGTVTWIGLESGQRTPSSGRIVLSVDDHPVAAQYGEAPIANDVGASSPETSIRRVQSFLQESGYLSDEADGRWGQRTSEASDRFLDDLGWPERIDFPASSVIWLGPDQIEPGEVSVAVGDIIAVGETIGTGGPIDASVRVRPSTDRSLDDEAGWLLKVHDVSVPLMRDYSLSLDDALALSSVLVEGVETAGVIRREAQVTRATIPGSAVVTDGDRTCVVRPDSSERADVEVLSSGLEGVTIRVTTNVPDTILLEPAAGTRC